MQYKNNNRKQGLTGLMRVKNEAQTLAQSIDSCIDALDELIITYHECTDGSEQIIENKKLQYPDKIIVIPYYYHVIGVDATDEEYEYAKSLPIGHPQLLASYYNNALQYVSFKFVMKIDADQIYFTQSLKKLRDSIVNGVNQNKIERFCGKAINYVFCQKRGSKQIWSKWHLLHWLQYIVVPFFRKQYIEYSVSELLKGKGYLSLSGVNVLRYNNQWCSPPLGCRWSGGIWWPYMGASDHLVFEANEKTEFVLWDYTNGAGTQVLLERFNYPKEKDLFLLGFYWFHLKPMKKWLYDKCLSYAREHPDSLLSIDQLGRNSFDCILKYLETNANYDHWYFHRRNYFNFVHTLDKRAIIANTKVLYCYNNE